MTTHSPSPAEWRARCKSMDILTLERVINSNRDARECEIARAVLREKKVAQQQDSQTLAEHRAGEQHEFTHRQTIAAEAQAASAKQANRLARIALLLSIIAIAISIAAMRYQ